MGQTGGAAADGGAQARGLVVSRFSTDLYDPRHRHDAWRNQGWPSLAPTLDSRPEPGFHATSDSLMLGALSVIYGRFGAQTVGRSAERIRAAPAEHLNVCLVVRGTLDGSWARLRPGDIGVCDVAAQWQHKSSECEFITLAIPRPLALDLGFDPAALHGSRITGPAAALLHGHLRQIRDAAATLAPAAAPQLARTVTDLLAVGLAGVGRPVRPSERAAATAVRMRADRLIAGSLERPDLAIDLLCRELGVSRSTLYRLFAAEGGVERRIRHERLRAAQRDLATGDARIGAVAERYGFSEPGHFSRLFRAEFGIAPRDYRAMLTAGHAAV